MLTIDPKPLFEVSPYLYMQFMEPLGVTDGSAGPEEAGDWVNYCNKRTGGLPVRLWQIGNETSYDVNGFNCETAAERTLAFAKAMRRVDPDIDRFRYINASMFEVDDGSGASVRCEVPAGVALDQGWRYVSVTGVSSCYKNGLESERLIRVRSQSDIKSY